MKSADRTYEFRCPVHGFIQVTDQERELIAHPVFQRLRRIRQLAWTEMVYPGALHSRFEHSLGVLHVATQLFDALVRRSKDVLKSELGYNETGLDRFRNLVRLAALLHDVGHGPFSHAAEELAPERPDGNGKYVHEDYSAAIIRAELRDIIKDHPVNKNYGWQADDVAALLEGRASAGDALFWRGLIDGQLDADRMDYLLRDSLHAGVQYGRYDLGRLLESVEVISPSDDSGVRVGISAGGVHAAEALILARYFMFTQVYFHKTRSIYDYHLEKALQQILPDGLLPPPMGDALAEYLKWDDWRVFGELSGGGGGEHGAILLERNHYRCVYETPEIPSLAESSEAERVWGVIVSLRAVRKTAGKSWYKAGADDIPTRGRDGRVRPLSYHSNVVRELKPSSQLRFYVPLSNRDEAARRIKDSIGTEEQ